MLWTVPKIWQGGDVWILGGGASLTKQFNIPEKVVEAVREGYSPISSYSEYMGALKNKHVIAVNIAFMIGTWIDMVFFGDNGFFLKYQKQIAAFSGIRVSCNPLVYKHDWVKYLAKDKNKLKGISDNPQLVSWNSNSGAAAINLAVHAGAKRIFLLGFDMDLDENGKQHWHDEYLKGGFVVMKKGEKKGKAVNLPFIMHLKCFPVIAQDLKVKGVEVINVNPDSKIKVFKKLTLKEALKL